MDDNGRGHRDRGDTYTDLADAVVRGALHGTGTLDEPRLRRAYIVELDDWDQMTAELFMDVLADAGDLDTAARVLGLRRADVEGRLRRARTPSSPGVRGTYIVEFDQWDRMVARLLLSIVADVGSARAAAKQVRVPRSTLSAWVRRAT